MSEQKSGVVVDTKKAARTIIDDIEANKLDPNVTLKNVTVVYSTFNEALEAYKTDKLPVIGEGKNHGYGMSGGLGVAGLLGLVTGGLLLSKGKTGLGAIGLGTGAGLEVGAFLALPEKVPYVGYYYMLDATVEERVIQRYVLVKLPKKLSDEAFEIRSKAQVRQRIREKAYRQPTPFEVEVSAERKAHADEVESNGHTKADIDEMISDADEPEAPPVEPAKPSDASSSSSSSSKDAPASGVVTDKSSQEIAAESKQSGVSVA